MRTLSILFKIAWHEVTCPGALAGASVAKNGSLGRIYSCGCGFELWEAYSC